MASPERRNPFYLLLLLASCLFVVTAIAVTVVPVLEEKARAAGQARPPSEFRRALREEGWRWVLCELVPIVVFALLSMGLDRLRRLQKERAAATIPLSDKNPASR